MITIHSLDVTKKVYSEKKNWLKINDEVYIFDYCLWDDWRAETKYFTTYDEMSKYIDSLTEGYIQYWVDLHVDDTETLEYHNGEEWDIEYTFKTGRIDLPENIVKYIVDEYTKEGN